MEHLANAPSCNLVQLFGKTTDVKLLHSLKQWFGITVIDPKSTIDDMFVAAKEELPIDVRFGRFKEPVTLTP